MASGAITVPAGDRFLFLTMPSAETGGIEKRQAPFVVRWLGR
jgi:hypothetical protein